MGDPGSLGRVLIVAGLALAGFGLLVVVLGRFGVSLFHLPGDIRIEGKAVTCFIPLATMLLLSLLLTVVATLIARGLHK